MTALGFGALNQLLGAWRSCSILGHLGWLVESPCVDSISTAGKCKWPKDTLCIVQNYIVQNVCAYIICCNREMKCSCSQELQAGRWWVLQQDHTLCLQRSDALNLWGRGCRSTSVIPQFADPQNKTQDYSWAKTAHSASPEAGRCHNRGQKWDDRILFFTLQAHCPHGNDLLDWNQYSLEFRRMLSCFIQNLLHFHSCYLIKREN